MVSRIRSLFGDVSNHLSGAVNGNSNGNNTNSGVVANGEISRAGQPNHNMSSTSGMNNRGMPPGALFGNNRDQHRDHQHNNTNDTRDGMNHANNNNNTTSNNKGGNTSQQNLLLHDPNKTGGSHAAGVVGEENKNSRYGHMTNSKNGDEKMNNGGDPRDNKNHGQSNNNDDTGNESQLSPDIMARYEVQLQEFRARKA